ncbi:glycoside hydrolase domain-containing protein, partial [Actinomadura adrarensis]
RYGAEASRVQEVIRATRFIEGARFRDPPPKPKADSLEGLLAEAEQLVQEKIKEQAQQQKGEQPKGKPKGKKPKGKPTPKPKPKGKPSKGGKAWVRGKGFDTCAAPALSSMKAWRRAFKVSNIYIGGAMRGCAQPNLTRGWVKSVRGMGYRLIPTYVGPQAACTRYRVKISSRSAAAQGR